MATFVTNKNLSGSAGNYLLKGLKDLKHQNNQFDCLPSDIRTLRKTPRKVVVEHICGGTYFHFGLEKGIASRLSELVSRKDVFTSSLLQILISTDGLPLLKSTRKEFWVILALIKGDDQPNLIYKSRRITIRPPNNNVVLELDDKSTAVVAIEKIIRVGDGSISIVGSIFEQETPFFMAPCDSNSILSIKYVDSLSASLQVWPVESFCIKCFLYRMFLMVKRKVCVTLLFHCSWKIK